MRVAMQLPYFPLHTVAFPHLPLPIHAFEERYRAMAADLVAEGSPFEGRFVVSMIDEGPEVGGDASTRPIGTICEVRTAERLPDGWRRPSPHRVDRPDRAVRDGGG